MKTPISLLSLLTALSLAGCAAPPAIAPVAVEVNGHPADAPVFAILQAAPVGTVFSASSAANDTFYAATNATDGVETSAWRPAGTDAFPSLRFDLPSPIWLTGLGIKLSLGRDATAASSRVFVAVETSDDGTNWTTLAMGLQPTETVLQTLDLPDVSARHVRVSFVASGAGDIADLLVCETRLDEGVAPVAVIPTPATGNDGGDTGGDGGDTGNDTGNTGGDGGDGGDTGDTGGTGNGSTGGNRGVGQGNGGGNGTPNEGNGGNNGNNGNNGNP